jgi:hypothetical protein
MSSDVKSVLHLHVQVKTKKSNNFLPFLDIEEVMDKGKGS